MQQQCLDIIPAVFSHAATDYQVLGLALQFNSQQSPAGDYWYTVHSTKSTAESDKQQRNWDHEAPVERI